MQNKKIDLGDGDYVVLPTEMYHRTNRLVLENMRKYLKPVGKPMLLSDIKRGANPLAGMEIDMTRYDDDESVEIIILSQVSEWSFGEVNKESLDKMPQPKYEVLKAEVSRLYQPTPLAGANKSG